MYSYNRVAWWKPYWLWGKRIEFVWLCWFHLCGDRIYSLIHSKTIYWESTVCSALHLDVSNAVHWTGFTAQHVCVFDVSVRELNFSVLTRTPCCLQRSLLLKWWDCCPRPPPHTHCWLSTQQPSLEVSIDLFRADSAFDFLLSLPSSLPSFPSFLPSLFFWGAPSRYVK